MEGRDEGRECAGEEQEVEERVGEIEERRTERTKWRGGGKRSSKEKKEGKKKKG